VSIIDVMGGRAAPQPKIWIVSADQWPRACLRAELIERGYDAVGFVTMKDALIRLMLARSRAPALLVVDLHGQDVQQMQHVNEKVRATLIREHVPLLVVTDGAHPEDGGLGPTVRTLRRPITIGAIADTVDRLMGRAPRGAQPSVEQSVR
jgi:DNA-binding response OmpR family regulator